jgi:hypothetical protein
MLSLIFGNAQQRRGSYPALLRRAGRVPRPNGKGLAPPQAGPAWLRAVSLSEKSPVSAGAYSEFSEWILGIENGHSEELPVRRYRVIHL